MSFRACEKIYLTQTYQKTLENVKILSMIKLSSMTSEHAKSSSKTTIMKQLQKLCGHDKVDFYKIILDKTIFHPQGGGQPCDEGVISINIKSTDTMVNAQFNVKLVKLEEDLIQIGHYGWFDENDEIHVEKLLNPLCNESATEQVFNVHNTNNNGFEISANLEIDLEKRILFSKIHSAGHVLDLAVVNCGYTCWKSGKGYHFPDSPYCEYQHCHQLPSQNDSMVTIVMNQLNEEIENIMTRQDLSVEKSFIPYPCDHLGHENDNSELASKFPNNQIPPYLPPGQPVRFVKYGSVECACSGTHVDKFKEIGEFKVTRVKKQGSLIKISYQVL